MVVADLNANSCRQGFKKNEKKKNISVLPVVGCSLQDKLFSWRPHPQVTHQAGVAGQVDSLTVLHCHGKIEGPDRHKGNQKLSYQGIKNVLQKGLE